MMHVVVHIVPHIVHIVQHIVHVVPNFTPFVHLVHKDMDDGPPEYRAGGD